MAKKGKPDEKQMSPEEIDTLWMKRARGFMIGGYQIKEIVEICGLYFRYSNSQREHLDVFVSEDMEKKGEYIDTINISQFTTASDFVNYVTRYVKDGELPDEPERTDDESTPTIQTA